MKQNNNLVQVNIKDVTKSALLTREDGLTMVSKSAYAVGHVMNDITANFLIIYMVYYLTDIVELPQHYLSYVWLVGQVVDGVITPVFGAMSDCADSPIGKRKPFYIAGVILNFVCILCLMDALGDFFNFKSEEAKAHPEQTSYYQFIYYLFFFTMYNVGFALIQVAHMSVIPTSSANDDVRGQLTAYRTSFTFISGLTTMVISMMVTAFYNLDEAFYYIVWLISLLGLACSIFYIFCYNEVYLTEVVNNYFKSLGQDLPTEQGQADHIHHQLHDQTNRDNQCLLEASMTTELAKTCKTVKATSWMSLKMFWVYMITYASARVTQNFSVSLMAVYLNNALGSKSEIVLVWVPFTYMLSSFLGSWTSAFLLGVVKRKTLTLVCNIGILLANLSLVLIYSCLEDLSTRIIWAYVVYGILGYLTSIYLAVATCLISDLIGEYGTSGAFVYGFYSMADKLSVGFTVFLFYEIFDVHTPSSVAYGVTWFPAVFLVASVIVQQFTFTDTQFHRKDFN